MNIPLLYWNSKQHKTPYKFRFIAGATQGSYTFCDIKIP